MTMDSSFHRTSVLVWMLLTTILGKYVILKLKAWLVLDFIIGFPWGFLSYLCCGWLCQRKIMHQDMFWVEPRQETHWNYVECIM
jgi:hypothetical protein